MCVCVCVCVRCDVMWCDVMWRRCSTTSSWAATTRDRDLLPVLTIAPARPLSRLSTRLDLVRRRRQSLATSRPRAGCSCPARPRTRRLRGPRAAAPRRTCPAPATCVRPARCLQPLMLLVNSWRRCLTRTSAEASSPTCLNWIHCCHSNLSVLGYFYTCSC